MFTSLKQFRNTTGLSQEAMALQLRIGVTTYRNYEAGRFRPQRAFYFLLAHEFSYPVEDLLTIAESGRTLVHGR